MFSDFYRKHKSFKLKSFNRKIRVSDIGINKIHLLYNTVSNKRKEEKDIFKLKNRILFFVMMAMILHIFFTPTEVNAISGNKGHVFILSAHHTWSGNNGASWDRGAPNSRQSATKALDVKAIAENMGFKFSDVKNITVNVYDKHKEEYQNWDNDTFRYNLTNIINRNSNHKDNFDDQYIRYTALNNTVSNINFNKHTGKLTYKQTYDLKNVDGSKGLEIHAMLAEGESGKRKVLDWIGDDQPPEVMNKINAGVGNIGSRILGYVYFAPVVVTIEFNGESEMILREMELVDPETGKVLESFKRNLDPVDPFNKQTVVATHNNIKGASTLKKGKTYKVKAKYQYIDFSKGSFNISNPANMTPEQSALTTGVAPNTFDVKYAYDVKTGQQGQFDSGHPVTGTPTALKNLQEAKFEWNYVVPKDKKAVKIAGFVPSTFPKEKNASTKDDWGTLYAMIEPANLALNQPIELYDGSGKRTNVPVPGNTHSLIINGEHALGNVSVGLKHSNGNNPSANDRFTIRVSVREGSAGGN